MNLDADVEGGAAVDTGLSWSSCCWQRSRVMLTLRDGDHHTASVDMAAEEAVDLAQVLVHEMHGSCADVWLVERLADREHLWLTLSSTSRGMVRISRIELDSGIACQVATSLLTAAAECQPVPTLSDQLRQGTLGFLRTATRWAVQHTHSFFARPCNDTSPPSPSRVS